MGFFKHFLKTLVTIPNFPIIVVLSIYILYNINKHTEAFEIEMAEDDEIMSNEIKEHIQHIYPKPFKYFIAISFYIWLGFYIL